MSEDVTGVVIGISSKVAETGIDTGIKVVDHVVEDVGKLLKAIFSGEKGRGNANKDKADDIKSSDITDLKSGEVPIEELLSNAKKNADDVKITDSISESNKKFITHEAKRFGIPIAFESNPDGDSFRANVRESDYTIFKKIYTDAINESLKTRPQEFDNIKVNRGNIEGIQHELSANNINVMWGKTKYNECFMLFEKADKKLIELVKSQYDSKFKSVKNDLTITKSDESGIFTLKDEKSGKEISFSDIPSRNELSEIIQKELNYDENKALIACDKFGEGQLDGDVKRKFFSDNPQQNFAKVENHVELANENPYTKNYTCLRIIPKGDEVPRLVYRDDTNENYVVLQPQKTSRAKMAEAIREHLKISDEKTIEALVDKAEKVNDYYAKQDMENFTHVRDVPNKVKVDSNIERLDKVNFKVTSSTLHENSEKALVLSFSDKKKALIELQELYEGHGVPGDEAKEIAKEVFAKAKKQSAEKVLQIEEVRIEQVDVEIKTTATFNYNGKVEEIDVTERKAAVEELKTKFDISEESAVTFVDKAHEKVSGVENLENRVENQSERDKENKLINGHEKNPAEKIDLNHPKTLQPEPPKPSAPRKR